MFCDVRFEVFRAMLMNKFFWDSGWLVDVSEGHLGSMFGSAAVHLFLDDCLPKGGASNYCETSVTLPHNTAL